MRQAMEKNEIEALITSVDVFNTPPHDQFLNPKFSKWNFLNGTLQS